MALLPAHPGESLWIGTAGGKNHGNVGIGLGTTGGQAHEDYDQTLIEDGFEYSIAAGFEADKFYLNSDGNTVFRINAGAGRTSQNTSHPRSECRELTASGGKAKWDGRRGWHYLKARCRITDVTSNRPWVCFGQIHGSEGSPITSDLLRLQCEGANGTTTGLKLVARRSPVSGGSEITTVLRTGYDVGDWFNYEIHQGGPTSADDGRLRVLIDGVTVLDVTGMAQIDNYFKWGCYLQDNVEKGASANDWAAVEFERGSLVVWHSGTPAPTTPIFTGGSDGSGGTDSQAPSAPSDLTIVRASTQLALSWQESVDNVGVDHYNIYRTGPDGGSSSSTETFGKLTDGASSSASSANKTAVSKHTATDTGTLTGGHVRAWITGGGSTNTKCVVYADSAGAPGALLAESDVVVLSAAAEAEVDYTFSGAEQIAITSGVDYWMGLSWQDPGAGSLNLSRDATASSRQENSSYLADPFGAPTALAGPIDCYLDVEVTTAAAGTIGKTLEGAGTTASSADKIIASVATSEVAGTLTEGHARLWLSSAGSTNAKMAVYEDDGGDPGALLATSDQLAITNTATADKTFTFSGAEQIDIDAATDYWIAIIWDDPGSVSITYSRDATSAKRRERSDVTYGTLPDPWGTSTANLSGPIDAWLVTSGGAGGVGEELIATSTGTAYLDTGLTDGTEYTYRVNAEDAAGNVSGFSESVSETPGAPDTTAPTVPANLSAVGGDKIVTLTWDASTDADSGVDAYRLYRDGSLLIETELLTYVDTGRNNGTIYSYTVSAVDVAGNESAQSSADEATPAAPTIGGVPLLPAELGPDAKLQVQIAFGADLTADPTTWDWTDVTEDVRQASGISCSLGRDNESSRSNPAELTLVLNDASGDYSLGGRSQHYPYVRRGTPVRLRVDPGDAAGARILFFGNANGFTPSWASTSLTGETRVVTLSASGTLRRLAQGDAPVMSAYRRAMIADATIVAYWPMEEGRDAGRAVAVRGGSDLVTTAGEPNWGSDDAFDCSSPLPVVKTGVLNANVDTYASTGENEVRLLLCVPDDGLPDGTVLAHVTTTGTLARWDITYETGTGGTGLGVYRWNSDGTRQGDNTISGIPLNGEPVRLTLQLTQSGSDVVWLIGVTPVGSQVALFFDATIPGKTVGIVSHIELNPHGTAGDTVMGHVTVGNDVQGQFAENDALIARVGENPTSSRGRLVRLCEENGLRLTRYSSAGESISSFDAMGPQLVAPLLDLINDCESADQAQVWDGRDVGLSVTTRRYRENGNVALTLDVSNGELAPGFAPVDDDQRTRNKWTITRLQGVTATYEDTDGPLGTEIIGEYDDSATVNTRFDEMAVQHAAWRVHLGTVEGYRFPSVTLNTRAAPHLVPDALDVIPGDRIDLVGIADDAAPLTGGTVSLIVEGIEHEITAGEWLITYKCSLFSPWGVGRLADETGDDDPLVMRLDTDGSSLAEAASVGATTISVASDADVAVWTSNADDYPLWLSIGGVPVRATACADATSPQTITVDPLPVARRAGDAVALWDPRPVGIG